VPSMPMNSLSLYPDIPMVPPSTQTWTMPVGCENAPSACFRQPKKGASVSCSKPKVLRIR
jgi:hypothetical protein